MLENAMIGTLFGGSARSEDEAREAALEALRFVGLDGKADLPAKVLNIQEKKRLELARDLAARPRLLLLDEVLAGLTPVEVERMLCLLDNVRREWGQP
ncbi:ABC-type branched-chain amino acid transporter [Aeropyrum camini SY1 = JCM 12091]|uniref:ABC-type branched-chain amino acid transporter n=1 Tax=Aeropyrum camini SY1 = JCM 12091 TaxID=1198449 RepID=U3TC17_9CREN|nr:ABC-type branched-chain amino acid transporter [Aeropyrum camini SY1 = JCM 12091]